MLDVLKYDTNYCYSFRYSSNVLKVEGISNQTILIKQKLKLSPTTIIYDIERSKQYGGLYLGSIWQEKAWETNNN